MAELLKINKLIDTASVLHKFLLPEIHRICIKEHKLLRYWGKSLEEAKGVKS
jgi:hypothetical protein